MTATGTQTARGARDALASLLNLGAPYPLRDLTLDYVDEVPHDLSTDLLVRGAQPGVVYQLCTEEGEPLKGADRQPISAELSAGRGGEPTLASSPVFIPGDLRDAGAFLAALAPTAAGVGALVRGRFKPATLAALDTAAGNNDAACAAVLKDLSGIVRQGTIYDANAFRSVSLSPWTRALLRRPPSTDAERVRLNRFLLEDAFPLVLWRTLALATPPITEDVTFTLLASREDNVLVEAPLTASASIRAGIAAGLTVRFPPGAGTVATVPYGGTPTVAVDDSQEGISYQLFSDANPSVPLSDPQLGNRGTVLLVVNRPLQEDTGIKVKAFRTLVPATLTFLRTTVRVQVGPNPAVAVQVNPAVTDCRGTPVFTLAGAQASATYTLWQRPVAPEDYQAPAAPGLPVSVPADALADPPWPGFVGVSVVAAGQRSFQLSVRVPDLGDGTTMPAGFGAGGDFKLVNNAPQVTAAPLREDALFVVHAAKANGTSLILNQTRVVLVRPDPQPTLGAARSPVNKGTPGVVLVTNPQKGVRYRLVRDADGVPVQNPGYYPDDRGLETARVETDFAVESPGDAPVALPTDPLAGQTKFRVVAVKNATALTTPLQGTVTIDVVTPPAGPA